MPRTLGFIEKGTEIVPFLFNTMENEELISRIREMTDRLLETSPEYFVVNIRIKPTGNVKVFIDGDQGVNIDKLAGINRPLYKQLLALSLFPEDDFSLEISSPGLDEPLKMLRQYLKNIGRKVEVLMEDGTIREGVLLEADESGISIEETTGKKQIKTQIKLLFSQFRHTKVTAVFKN